MSLRHAAIPPIGFSVPVTDVVLLYPPAAPANRPYPFRLLFGLMTERKVLGLPLRWPIVGAPMAGGPSTPALAGAVSNAGGLGFLAAGYLDATALGRQVGELRRLTRAPFGVNLFVPQYGAVDEVALDRYIASLRTEAEALGVEAVPTWDDDGWEDKLELLTGDPVPVVSFTFGCPTPEIVRRLQKVGSRVVVTATTPIEASVAREAGADGVAAQGIEAGGHQATFADDAAPDTGWGLLALVTAIRHEVPLPVIAAGGLMTGADVAAVISAGAGAAALGTALLRCPESGASEVHKAALSDRRFGATAITRAFSGRRARGLVNAFMDAHPDAPSAYPHINNATRALRRAAVARGDPHGTNLWAGQGFRLARHRPAAEIISTIGYDFEARAVRGWG
jgi:nitronate monooxygenase